MAVTVLLLLLGLSSGVYCDEGVTRKLTVTREYDACMDQLNDSTTCSSHQLGHVVSESAADTLHVLVSLWAQPSVLLLHLPAAAPPPSIDWTLLTGANTTGAIQADQVLSSYGLSLDQLIEFDDPEDTADVTHANATSLRPFALDIVAPGAVVSNWTSTNDSGEQGGIHVRAPPLNASDWTAVGNVTFSVEVLDTSRRTDELPHLQQTGTSAVASLVLDKLLTSSGYKHSRFGVQMTTVGNRSQSLQVIKSLDDEYTPGVFKLVSLSSSATSAGYLQWRPVAYTAPEYIIEHSTTARHYAVRAANATAASPLLRAYFGERALTHQLNVTFGLSEDGWYTDAKYSAWELTVGIGAPPEDEFSLMVILLLGFGLGLPTVALVGGGLWMAVRKVRGQSASPASLLVEEE
ncbi:glycosylated lysosomal membrane protein-like [Amphibalanus amphitrite]|uniref:glycosylated lysosomal membrane protein-like n=1 Tax=Amphibalanus amphitrite TaxID=1232801 RepID=UPI001C92A8E2|nr:glycosylated lysosomal membrane protein-like [Amphibalanus amphitrite]XP_043225609.1 glycosylated lysosomal membrane protein-like [Amphibalanus amphitrite]XP_043242300.1 glycosylated lysosomal membrane protein-like [Amphibalanus amphitrite]XP_043242301.1 glycosylated lysosomal membrane protein-like [Amphibalanus amphitrite]